MRQETIQLAVKPDSASLLFDLGMDSLSENSFIFYDMVIIIIPHLLPQGPNEMRVFDTVIYFITKYKGLRKGMV